MKTLGIDLETYSEVPIKDCGSFRYIEDDSFEILLFAYSVDGAPAVVVDFTAGETLPGEVLNAIWDPAVTKTAFNAAFERAGIGKHFGRYCPPEQWEDTMILAASCGYPLKLETCGQALHLPEDQAKMKEGKALIREFCIPQKRPLKKWDFAERITPEMDPENWKVFKEYNARDVDTEGLIRSLLLQWKPDDTEHRFWCLDARINEKGMRADLELARQALRMDALYKEELREKAKAVSGLENPGSNSQIKQWLFEEEGLEVESLNKKAVPEVIAALKTERTKEFMDIRTELSKTSTKKYDAFLRCACADEHVRGCFQFFGGHTGRFAGRLVQLQNLPQNHMSDLDTARSLVRMGDYEGITLLYPNVTGTLSELLRTVLIPEDGQQFIVSDFSAIEARVIAWIAGEDWRLDVFRKGGDIYCASVTQMFGIPCEKNGINGDMRPTGKVAELGLGFGGGVGALLAFGADRMGLSPERMTEIVQKWREASPRITALWKALERAMKACILNRATTVSSIGNIRFRWDRGNVFMKLPSGREMAYVEARYEESKRNPGRKAISFMDIDQKTRKWDRIETFGGRLTENLVQATARDCLRETMMRLDAAGWDIRGHVHDEVICTEPINGKTVEDMCEIFATPIPWAPDLPLRGAGYACSSYRKD